MSWPSLVQELKQMCCAVMYKVPGKGICKQRNNAHVVNTATSCRFLPATLLQMQWVRLHTGHVMESFLWKNSHANHVCQSGPVLLAD